MSRVRTSVWTVEAAVPALEDRRFITDCPPEEAKVPRDGSHVAPGTPGPPEPDRTRQPWAARSGAVCAAQSKPANRGGAPPGSVGAVGSAGVGGSPPPDAAPHTCSPPRGAVTRSQSAYAVRSPEKEWSSLCRSGCHVDRWKRSCMSPVSAPGASEPAAAVKPISRERSAVAVGWAGVPKVPVTAEQPRTAQEQANR